MESVFRLSEPERVVSACAVLGRRTVGLVLMFAGCGLLLASCSDDALGVRPLSESTALRYLRGEVTVETVEAELALPGYAVASPVVREQLRLARDAPGVYDFYYLGGKRGTLGTSGADEGSLSVSRLTDYEAERLLLADRVDLAGSLAQFYEPSWYGDDYTGEVGALGVLGRELTTVIEGHFAASRVPVLQRLYAAYDRVYCLRSHGIMAVPTLSSGYQIVDEWPGDDTRYFVEREIRGERANLHGSPNSTVTPDVLACADDAVGRVWPLPYDARDAWEWYRHELHGAVEAWLAQNPALVPHDLHIEP